MTVLPLHRQWPPNEGTMSISCLVLSLNTTTNLSDFFQRFLGQESSLFCHLCEHDDCSVAISSKMASKQMYYVRSLLPTCIQDNNQPYGLEGSLELVWFSRIWHQVLVSHCGGLVLDTRDQIGCLQRLFYTYEGATCIEALLLCVATL